MLTDQPGFTGSLQLDFGDWGSDGRIAETMSGITWTDGKGVFALIPAGTMSDGATVPRPLWWFLPPWGDRSTLGAIAHDYLLWRLDMGSPVNGCETRELCDGQLYTMLLALRVPAWRARSVWLGVRAWSISWEWWQRTFPAEAEPV